MESGASARDVDEAAIVDASLTARHRRAAPRAAAARLLAHAGRRAAAACGAAGAAADRRWPQRRRRRMRAAVLRCAASRSRSCRRRDAAAAGCRCRAAPIAAVARAAGRAPAPSQRRPPRRRSAGCRPPRRQPRCRALQPRLPRRHAGGRPRRGRRAATACRSTAPDCRPPRTLHYQLQPRHRCAAAASCTGARRASSYELRLEGRVGRHDACSTQISPAASTPPASRRCASPTGARAARHQAANFQRDAGKITFSGPTHELPLLPGAQDRVSWMVQLGGDRRRRAAAAPRPARRSCMFVVGARGDAERLGIHATSATRPSTTDWARSTPSSTARTAQARTTRSVEVWLDPARHHLPVRATLRSGADGEALRTAAAT